MASIGQYNTLKVNRETGSGFYLDAGHLGEVLLPGNLAPPDLKWGAMIEVFLYTDSEDRFVATTERPHATVGEFAVLKVVSVHPRAGAFLDWGLGKDLLLPFREQGERRVEAGERVGVYIKVDERTDRVVATTKLSRYLEPAPPHYAPGQKVRLLITHRTPLGFNAVAEGRYSGLIYHTNLGTALAPGRELDGYVHAVRPDGKLDLGLDPAGPARFRDLADEIMDALGNAGGRLPYDDSSAPEAIREAFNTSKKTFKKAIGTLLRKRRIRFAQGGGIERI